MASKFLSKRGEAAPTAPTHNVARFSSKAYVQYPVFEVTSTSDQFDTVAIAKEAGQ